MIWKFTFHFDLFLKLTQFQIFLLAPVPLLTSHSFPITHISYANPNLHPRIFIEHISKFICRYVLQKRCPPLSPLLLQLLLFLLFSHLSKGWPLVTNHLLLKHLIHTRSRCSATPLKRTRLESITELRSASRNFYLILTTRWLSWAAFCPIDINLPSKS